MFFCVGSPDMIVEVVSPYNSRDDHIKKLNLYEQFKIREYWIYRSFLFINMYV